MVYRRHSENLVDRCRKWRRRAFTARINGIPCLTSRKNREILSPKNLLDDFLVNSLMSHREYGEAASKIIIGRITRRVPEHLTVVPQKVYVGEDPKYHGVRMDIYLDEQEGEIFDIEPDRNGGKEDIKALPRRVRFYHAKIDAGNLESGEDYSHLRNVVVIFITSYDPFGRNRMVYTIQNKCVEEPDMPYADGALSIFLYTRGTEGNPPQELRELLRYMEDSCEENATASDLRELHHMVTVVKRDREVGLEYMKIFEQEQRIRDRARAEGRAEDILEILSDKGEVSDDLREKIMIQRDMECLSKWLKAAVRSETIEKFEEKM